MRVGLAAGDHRQRGSGGIGRLAKQPGAACGQKQCGRQGDAFGGQVGVGHGLLRLMGF